ncbi:MAG: transposase [Methylobacterium sp.]|uniref:transposase n=1 Tax=Methylobacterium sp. TaxID=409 RepID=UPI0025CDE346|nr:transposase [Methylobacterium sp.]MBX9932832.1 transposase [Methylobacterium sp.]
MRRSQHTDDEMAFLLREAEQGIPVATICASAKISIGTFYRWRRRLGGLPPVAITRLRRIEEENSRLRAELARLTFAGRDRPEAEAARRRAVKPANRDGMTRHPSPVHRGSDIALGRFAFVRTTR